MLSKESLELLLSRAMESEADFAEIFEEETTNESISMLNGKVEDVNKVLRSGIGVRLYKNVQSVYGYTNELDMTSLTNLIDELKEAFGSVENKRSVQLTYEEIENKHPVKIDPIQANLEDKVALMKRAHKACKAEDKRIVKVQINMLNVKQHVQISNSNGKLVQDTRIRTRMPVTAYAQDEKSMQSGFEGPGASMGLEFYDTTQPEDIAKEAARIALVMLEAKDCPSGKMPVVIDNGFGGVIFHEACGHALEASAVSKDQSVFTNKLNTKNRIRLCDSN